MNVDPVLGLVALHSNDLQDAMDILLGQDTHSAAKAIDDAVHAFVDIVENGLISGVDNVQVDLQLAQYIAMALKQRRNAHGRPHLSSRKALLRKATVRFAERRVRELLQKGLKIGEARLQAAEEVSIRAHKSGDRIAASTLIRLMKENAALKKVRPPVV